MAKRKGRSGRLRAKDRAEEWLSKYIRLRDCVKTTGTTTHGACVTCGKIIPFNGSHSGHYIPGRSDACLFVETNVHLQCAKCNTFLGGAWVEYEAAIKEMYGEDENERLKALRYKVLKLTEEELRAISDDFRKRYNELKSNYD